ncbi:MAG: GTP-binding protein [Candidatus Lokiarchaeota archaeon]|jgi:small GTP-binding protein|nr:GTP-binding protein [Candidatus Lokiarchaeota archaeon]
MKILVAGPVKSGKSSFIKFLDPNALNVEAKGADNRSYTVGMDLGSIKLNGYKVYLFGTPGLIRFSVIRDITAAGSDGVLFIFDSAKPEKDVEAIQILNSIRKLLGPSIPIVFLANKQDLEEARYPEVVKIQNDLPESAKIFPTSTKTGQNIKESLKFLVNKVYENYKSLLEILKEYEDDLEGLQDTLNKNTSQMRDLLNKLEVKRFIELNRAQKTYKVKDGLKYLV